MARTENLREETAVDNSPLSLFRRSNTKRHHEILSYPIPLLFGRSQLQRFCSFFDLPVAESQSQIQSRTMVHREGMYAQPPSTMAVTPLSAITEAFEDLAKFINGAENNGNTKQQELRLDKFCHACSHVSVLFNSLGLVFKFAELEYISKLHSLMDASKTYDTLKDIIDLDVANGTVKTQGSLSRCLRRVRQGLDLVRSIFEQFLLTDDSSLKEAASTAYAQACAPYHSWTVRAAVAAGMYALPTRDQLLARLNETNQSAEKKMFRYINASVPVIEYIDKLYLSRNIRLDW